jgi:hypothetical protein
MMSKHRHNKKELDEHSDSESEMSIAAEHLPLPRRDDK